MRFHLFLLYILTSFAYLVAAAVPASGENIQVRGKVTDAATGEALVYANVVLLPASLKVNVVTNQEGKYTLQSNKQGVSIRFNYMGYEDVTVPLSAIKNGTLDVKLKPTALQMEATTLEVEKGRYNKRNPAVAIIEKTIAHKSRNRMENQAYYQFRQQEKMEFSITNISDSVKNTWALKKIKFVFDNVDTSSLTGKRYLPIYFIETLSDNYYRKDPKSVKKYIDAQKNVEISKFLPNETMDVLMREMFGTIDIYDNNVYFLSKQFMSPLSTLAPDFYKFWISDTTMVSGIQCFNIGFTPRNSADFGFMGHLYITADSLFALKRAELQVTSNTSLNYVNDLLVEQEYEQEDSIWVLRKDVTLVDFSLIGSSTLPFYGRKENLYTGYVFNEPQPEAIYKGSALVVRNKGFDKRDEDYWQAMRIEELKRSEKGIYKMFARLDSIWVYRFVVNTMMSLVGGYFEVGPVDVGPIGNTISWNSIEGMRFRIGGKTNGNVSKHFFAEAYLAYGTTDHKFKYNVTGHYSFNQKKNSPWEFPMNYLSVKYEYDTYIPGESYKYGTGDRLFISIGRGETTRMTLERLFSVNYTKEDINNFTYNINFTHLEQYPLGQLTFETGDGQRYDPYTTTFVSVALRYAPNEKYLQTQKYRLPINRVAPVYKLAYQYAIPGFWGGDYGFHKISASFDKRWYFASFGFLDASLNAGIMFNQAPYPSLFVHHANQSFAFQEEAYNSMRYLEFVSDKYAGVLLEYNFNGYIFNRIPLIKKLNWREVVAFKVLFGGIGDKNDPAQNPDLMRFPYDSEGNTTTFSLNREPFMEMNFGIDNIFTILRLDVVKRLSYLDNPGIQEWSVRAMLRFTF